MGTMPVGDDARAKPVLPANPDARRPEAWGNSVVASVIIPTLNEAPNIAPLLSRLDEVSEHVPIEVIFVDDSFDDTPDVVDALQRSVRFPVKLIHRTEDRREGGLGGAVVIGMRHARAPWVCVMDADLQHPPELILHMLKAGEGSDLVVATRYRELGDAAGLSTFRRAISRSATALGQLLLPHALRRVSDPMSGFFMVRRDTLPLDHLRPNGFKILVELLAKAPLLRVTEVPFQFGVRHAGVSKGSVREGLRYLNLLLHLRLGDTWVRLARFALVGTSGLLVNMALLMIMAEFLGMHYLIATVIATQGATLSNFALTEHWVFGDRGQPQGRVRRAATFLAMSNAVLLLHVPMMYVLTSTLGIHYAISNVATLVALMVFRFAASKWWIWSPEVVLHPVPQPVALTRKPSEGSLNPLLRDVTGDAEPGHL